MHRLFFVVLILLLPTQAIGGEFNEVLKIGDLAPAWKELPGVDGKKHSLADLKDKQNVVVVFTCNTCPAAKDYEDRIIEIANQWKQIAVVAINVNKVPGDSFEKMIERSKEKSFPYPYLYDETQQIAKLFGANFTPEFFVLDSERKISYMGCLDDNSDIKLVKRKYLHEAIEAILAGKKPEIAETLARGCRVRYAREQRK